VEIHESARKHGVADEDILHAVDHTLAVEDAGEEPETVGLSLVPVALRTSSRWWS
jgi:hypothetical protein